MNDLLRCYELLGVEPGATPDQVKQAYRDLVRVWHPDRFPNDPRLQQKASARLREINRAFERVQSSRAQGPTTTASAASQMPREARPAESSSQAGPPTAPPSPSPRSTPTPQAGPNPPRRRYHQPAWQVLLLFAALVGGTTMMAYILANPPPAPQAQNQPKPSGGLTVRDLDSLDEARVGPSRGGRGSAATRPPSPSKLDPAPQATPEAPGRTPRLSLSGLLAERPPPPPVQAPPEPEAYKTPAPRPENGTLLYRHPVRHGRGELTVHNGTGRDAVVALLQPSPSPARPRTYLAVYVRAGEKATAPRIAPGTYQIGFNLGTNWTDDKTFARDKASFDFEEPLAFTEQAIDTATERTIKSSAWSLTLHAVPGGNVRTVQVPDRELVPAGAPPVPSDLEPVSAKSSDP